MKKIILFLLFCSTAVILKADGWKPFFDTAQAASDGGLSIKLASSGSLCGRVVLKPIELSEETKKWIFSQIGNPQATINGIFLQAVRWRVVLFTLTPQVINDAQVQSDQYGALVGPLQINGLSQRYDWAGTSWQDHYKISCFIQLKPTNKGPLTFKRVPCDWVVEISTNDGKHDVSCVEGQDGPEAPYTPLNMNKA